MKQTIKGHIFNTDTAKHVGTFPSPNTTVSLHITRSGIYFLFYSQQQHIKPIGHHDAELMIERFCFKHPYR